ATIHRHSPVDIDVEIGGLRSTTRITRQRDAVHGDHLYVQTTRGTLDFDIVARFTVPGAGIATGGLTAPMPGTVLDIRVSVGDHVTAGATLVVLEAMKMEHHIRAPGDGVVTELFVTVGQQVGNGASLATIEASAAEGDQP
ncbi:MAG: acetyl-CoA carboxylase biotin carboxyl carrier protein subunit, partial [Actinomycetota bacterium]